MKNMKRGICYFAVLAVSIFMLASCSCTAETCGPEPMPQPIPQPKPAPPSNFETLHVPFAYDSAALSAQAEQILDTKVQWLRDNPNARTTVQGHCDERGTQEYNLALGDRRARSIKKYLVDSGIAANRISTISYGEERPLADGHNEAAWRLNRRGQFVINR